MLMLTRYAGQAVDLIDNRTGEVMASVMLMALLPDGSARLGFTAPDHITILRDDAKRRRDDSKPEG